MKKHARFIKPTVRPGFLFIWTLLFLSFSGSALAAALAGETEISRRGGKTDVSKKPARKPEKVPVKKESIDKRPADKSKNIEKTYSSMSSAEIRKRFLMDKPAARFTEADKQKVRRELKILRDRKSTQQFLTIVQIAEAGEPNIIVGDKPGCRVGNLKKHPALVLPSRCYYFYYNKQGKLVYSTASGNYQLTLTNYKRLAPFLDITDFEVPNQQLLALALIRDGGRNPSSGKPGFEALVRGDVPKAVKKATSDWAAFPTSDLQGRKRENVNRLVKGVMNGSLKPKTKYAPPKNSGKTETVQNRPTGKKNKKGI